MNAPARAAWPTRERAGRTERAVGWGFRHPHALAIAWLGLLACTGLLAGTARAATNDVPAVRFEPAPAWVAPIGVPETAGVPSELLHDGVADLLSDSQVRVGFGPQVSFNRYVSQVFEPTGVSSVGRIQIEFAATYQSLTLHWINVVRGGVVQERLDPAQVRIIQQEEDLALDLYYQSATALVLLDDIRVGDRVDYAYSITGANPIFEGRYQDWHYLEWWYPLGRIHTRIMAPADRPLHFKLHNTDSPPLVTRTGDVVEYVWTGDAVRARVHEEATPLGYDPLAAHQVSEFATWRDVVRWASETFDVEPGGASGDDDDDADDAGNREVHALADRIRREHDRDDARIIAALRFVQDEVRYLGLEIGVNAYEPHPPALTLERRYGDCKDKSSLLVALLRDLGVEAHVALVHTELGARVAELHPTANAFDHAIVRVRHAGLDYWLDPTLSYERGPLDQEEWPAYGVALVVDPAGESLTPVRPSQAATTPARLVHHYRTTSYTEPSEIEVTSTYRGNRADGFRGWLASMPRDRVERQYQNYYARDLKDIELAEPIRIEDDAETNTIVVHEHYRVPGLWQWDDERKRYVATFTARELRDELSSPDTVRRTHPLAYAHPVDTLLEITIETPEVMEVREQDERIVGPAFEYDYGVEQLERGVVLHYHYRSTADRVETRDVADHLEAVDDVWGTTEYWLGSSVPEGVAGHRAGRAGELDDGAGPRWSEPWRGAVVAFVAFVWLYGFGPAWSLRRALRALAAGRSTRALALLRRGRRLAPAWTTVYRRSQLVYSVTLGVAGRPDEARGTAAELTHMSVGPAVNDQVATAAWAWRAMLLCDDEPDRARACADRAVEFARAGSGAAGFALRSCALAARAVVHARLGELAPAAADLEEAASHRAGGVRAEPSRSWLAVLPLIASVEHAERALAVARGDLERAVQLGRAMLERASQDWPVDHPHVAALRLAQAELLLAAEHDDAARRELEAARAALTRDPADGGGRGAGAAGARTSTESALHARVRRLAEALGEG